MFGTSHIKGATGVEPGTVKFRRLEDLQICLRGYTRNEIMDVIIYAKDRHNLEELADHYRKVLPA